MPELPTDDTSEWASAIGPNGIPRINITAPVSASPSLPLENQTNYIMEPDLVEAQQGRVNLPPDVALNDAGIPFNKATGKEIPIVRRPNVLPVAQKDQDGNTIFAMPKMLDIFGSVMSPLAAPAVATKAGEFVLGSGAVRTMPEAAKAVEPAQPFFSTLEQAVDNARLTKGDASQWLGYLKNQPGVKAEEINTVLGDLPQGQITKDQLAGIIKDNGVKLGEVIKGGEIDPNNITQYAHEYVQDRYPQYNTNHPTYNALVEEKIADLEQQAKSSTKYHSYQFPGAENYQEMLMTLPEKSISREDALKEAKRFSNHIGEDWNKIPPNAQERYIEAARVQLEGNGGSPNNYKSSHWDEPNIVAHVRYNDRYLDNPDYKGPRKLTDADFTRYKQLDDLISKASAEGKDVKPLMQEQNEIGALIEGQKEATGKEGKLKTLHLEEVQSDWHQKGRAEGYKLSDKQKADLDNIEGKLTSKLSENEIGNPDIDNVLKVAVDKKVITPDEARNYKDYVKGENSTVPDAPFKKNWDELALKRMLHKAATEGYDALSWTPGEAQAARYDLSKQLTNITASKNPDGTFNLKGETSNGRTHTFGEKIGADKLSDTVGKDLAEKIANQKSQQYVYKDADLKIGGEGMKSFYDKMLVDKANALAKKYGSKVESKEIKAAPTYEIKNPILNKNGKEIVSVYKDGVFLADMEKSEATSYISKRKEIDKPSTIHFLRLTPELRQKAAQGFPLFSFTPTLTPVTHNPFTDQNKNYKLTPIQGNPFQ